MVNAIYLAYFLIAILNTWFLVQQIKTRKTLALINTFNNQVKKTQITSGIIWY